MIRSRGTEIVRRGADVVLLVPPLPSRRTPAGFSSGTRCSRPACRSPRYSPRALGSPAARAGSGRGVSGRSAAGGSMGACCCRIATWDGAFDFLTAFIPVFALGDLLDLPAARRSGRAARDRRSRDAEIYRSLDPTGARPSSGGAHLGALRALRPGRHRAAHRRMGQQGVTGSMVTRRPCAGPVHARVVRRLRANPRRICGHWATSHPLAGRLSDAPRPRFARRVIPENQVVPPMSTGATGLKRQVTASPSVLGHESGRETVAPPGSLTPFDLHVGPARGRTRTPGVWPTSRASDIDCVIATSDLTRRGPGVSWPLPPDVRVRWRGGTHRGSRQPTARGRRVANAHAGQRVRVTVRPGPSTWCASTRRRTADLAQRSQRSRRASTSGPYRRRAGRGAGRPPVSSRCTIR